MKRAEGKINPEDRTQRTTRNAQRGFISIFSVLIIMSILSLVAVGFSTITRRAQRQTLDEQLSTQAFDAAESGVNDARAALAANPNLTKSTCQTVGDGFNYNLDTSTNTGYTCLLISNPTADLRFDSVPIEGTSNPKVVNFQTASGQPITSFDIDWDATGSGAGTAAIPSYSTASYPYMLDSAAGWGSKLGIVRVDLRPIDGALDRNTLLTTGYTFFVVPTTNSPNGASQGVASLTQNQGGMKFMTCGVAVSPCHATIQLLAPAAPANLNGGTARYKHNAVFYNNKMYIWSGLATPSGYYNTMDIFDFGTNTWSTGPAGGTARNYAAAAVYNNKMYLWGGVGSATGTLLNTMDIFDFGTNTWSTGPTGGTGRSGTSTLVNGSKWYLWSGNGAAGYVNTMDIFDFSTNTWSVGPAGGTARIPRPSAVSGNKLYFWGGSNPSGGYYNTMDIFDTTTNTWSSGASGGSGRGGASAVLYGSKIYWWGGASGGPPVNTMDIYDIPTNTWSVGTAGGTARVYHSAVVYGSKMYVWGGTDSGSNALNTMDTYDFVTNTWNTGSTSSRYMMRLQSLYNTTQVKISNVLSGATVQSLKNGQAIIDSTGKANDVQARVQARIPLLTNGFTPGFALQTADSICKRLLVGSTDTTVDTSSVAAGDSNLQTGPCAVPSAANP